MNNNKTAIILVSVIGLTLLYFVFAHKTAQLNQKTLSIGDTVITIEVADNQISRERGLSGKKSLPDSEGMLFIFPRSSVYGFWMKEMFFPIDIIWISEEKKVVSVSENLLPESYPELFYPEGPVRYVLEVPAGFSKKHNVASGEEVRF